jgi:uncharacterized membrane protein
MYSQHPLTSSESLYKLSRLHRIAHVANSEAGERNICSSCEPKPTNALFNFNVRSYICINDVVFGIAVVVVVVVVDVFVIAVVVGVDVVVFFIVAVVIVAAVFVVVDADVIKRSSLLS